MKDQVDLKDIYRRSPNKHYKMQNFHNQSMKINPKLFIP